MIEGVQIKNLITHKDERGFFREIIRFPENFENIPVGQLSHSFVKEGVVKAWHSHVYQHQWNYVVSGKINVVLIDNRKESNTYKNKIEFIAGDDNQISYYFPAGVLHGYNCIEGPKNIIYITSGVYDLADEIRITPDDLKNVYNWDND